MATEQEPSAAKTLEQDIEELQKIVSQLEKDTMAKIGSGGIVA